jgi:hypothetical protein
MVKRTSGRPPGPVEAPDPTKKTGAADEQLGDSAPNTRPSHQKANTGWAIILTATPAAFAFLWTCRTTRNSAFRVDQPGTEPHESTRQLGPFLRDVFNENAKQANFRLFCPDETNSNRLGAVFQATERCLVSRLIGIDDHVSHDGRILEV